MVNQSQLLLAYVKMPNQTPATGSKSSSSGSFKYPARDAREKYRDSTSGQGDGWRSEVPSIKKRYKGPGICSLCCGVCCGAAQELVEYLSFKGVIDITPKVIHLNLDLISFMAFTLGF